LDEFSSKKSTISPPKAFNVDAARKRARADFGKKSERERESSQEMNDVFDKTQWDKTQWADEYAKLMRG
jgi:hypothetical protein